MFLLIKNLNKAHIFSLLMLTGLFGLQFVVDVKSLLLIFLVFFFGAFFLLELSIKEILFFVVILSLSFEKGIRGWNMDVVTQGRDYWMTGFSMYYGVSIRTLATLTLIILSFPDLIELFRKKMGKRLSLVFWLVVLFSGLAFVSTLYSSDFVISMFGLLRIFQAVGLFFAIIPLLKNKKFKKYLLTSFVCLLIFNSYFSLIQFRNQAPLGLYLEDARGANLLGYFTSDGERYYRTSGLIGHPTFFASFMSMIFAVVFGLTLDRIAKHRKKTLFFLPYVSVVILAIVSIYTTFVRSSWGTVAFLIFLFGLFLSKNQKRLLDVIKKYYLVVFGIVGGFLVFAGKQFFQRIQTSFEFVSSGSGVVRIALIKQALIMTRNYPIFGVGLNLNPRAMVDQNILPPNLRGFMFPVHNTFFLFLAELGLPAGIVFIAILIAVLFLSYKYVKNNVVYFGIWLGVFAFILNAQVHTLFNHDPSFDLLFILLGFLTHLCLEKKLR